MEQLRTPEDEDIIRDAIESRLFDVYTSIPGQVLSYDASTWSCSVQVTVKERVVMDDGTVFPSPVAVQVRVPFCFQGGAAFRQRWDPAAGDSVQLVYCHRSIERWKSQGGIVDPSYTRMHDLSDAVAMPGPVPFNAIVSAANGSPTSGPPSAGVPGGPQIAWTAGQIQLGSTQDNIALASIVLGLFQDLIQALVANPYATLQGQMVALSNTPRWLNLIAAVPTDPETNPIASQTVTVKP